MVLAGASLIFVDGICRTKTFDDGRTEVEVPSINFPGQTVAGYDLIVETPERLDKFLSAALPEHSRSKLAKMAEEGTVLVNGEAVKPSHKLRAGDAVELEAPHKID